MSTSSTYSIFDGVWVDINCVSWKISMCTQTIINCTSHSNDNLYVRENMLHYPNSQYGHLIGYISDDMLVWLNGHVWIKEVRFYYRIQ